MKINIQEKAIDIEDLKLNLASHFSGKYGVTTRNKKMLDVAATKNIGATVILTKKHLNVTGGFPSAKRTMVFTLLTIALGVLIPLIVYFLVFHKKMKVVEKDVADYINTHYIKQL